MSFFLFIFYVNIVSSVQCFRYFKPDTMLPNIVYFRLKGQEKDSKPILVDWHWQNERKMILYLEVHVFKAAFQDVDWKEVPALTKVGVFFRFDKTLHIDYVHFIIYVRVFHRDDLSRLEKNFLTYVHLLKKVDLGDYVYTDDPTKFEPGIGRLWLIRENSDVGNEK